MLFSQRAVDSQPANNTAVKKSDSNEQKVPSPTTTYNDAEYIEYEEIK